MKNAQYHFLKLLCDLFDGEHFVLESDIRALWPECPPHNHILSLGCGDYFESNYSINSPGYIPLPQGFALVDGNKEIANEELRRIAVALEKRLEIAEREAIDAKRDAQKALRHSQASNIIAGFASLITFISWLFPLQLP